MNNLNKIRLQFPQLAEKVYGKPLVYLDNAATALRPIPVLAKWGELSSRFNSNLHRAVHHIAAVATEEYESTRDAVKDFINASSREEIVFTSGATASLNLLAFSIGESMIREGDEIIVSEADHHSDIVPWQMMCGRRGAVLKVLKVDDRGYLDVASLKSLISGKTKVVCVPHISNVLGLINPVKEVVNICKSNNCISVIDGAQGIVHAPVDVQDLGCDFYAFSGHKVYAAPGTGVLYGRKELLEKLPPYMGGGEMIASVSWEKTTYAPIPGRFEAGTQNMAGVPTLKPALEMVGQLRETEENSNAIRDYMLDELRNDASIRLFGDPVSNEDKIPLFSFAVDGAHHEDLALILDKMGIAVRSGQMCAEPLMDRFGVSGMVRASFAPYNTMEEAEYFIKSLHKAVDMLR